MSAVASEGSAFRSRLDSRKLSMTVSRIMARRDSAGVRLISRHGNDFTSRFPLVVAAVTALPAHSFLIDGEAIATNDDGLAVCSILSAGCVMATRRCFALSI